MFSGTLQATSCCLASSCQGTSSSEQLAIILTHLVGLRLALAVLGQEEEGGEAANLEGGRHVVGGGVHLHDSDVLVLHLRDRDRARRQEAVGTHRRRVRPHTGPDRANYYRPDTGTDHCPDNRADENTGQGQLLPSRHGHRSLSRQ